MWVSHNGYVSCEALPLAAQLLPSHTPILQARRAASGGQLFVPLTPFCMPIELQADQDAENSTCGTGTVRAPHLQLYIRTKRTPPCLAGCKALFSGGARRPAYAAYRAWGCIAGDGASIHCAPTSATACHLSATPFRHCGGVGHMLMR